MPRNAGNSSGSVRMRSYSAMKNSSQPSSVKYRRISSGEMAS